MAGVDGQYATGGRTPDLIAFVEGDGRLSRLDDAGRELLGLAPDADATGLRLADLVLGGGSAAERVLATASRDRVWAGDLALGVHGRTVDVFLVCAAQDSGFAVVARTASATAFTADLELGMQALEDPEAVMALATRALGTHLGVDRCAYARTEPDEDHFVMSGDHATGLPSLVGRFAMSQFGSGCLRAMRAGEPWVVHDSADDDRLLPEDLAVYRATGIRAVVCLPLHKSGRFVAAMAVHHATARRWTRAEIDLVVVVGNRCWESMQRTHASRALRESEEHYRLLVELATDAIWMVDRDLRFVDANAAACELLGYRREDLLGMAVTDLVVAENEDRLADLVADRPTPQVVTEVWDVRRADGTVLSVELSVQSTPGGLQAISRDVTARRRAEVEQDELLQREREIAQAMQQSLLPRELPELARLAASARYLPASTHAQTGGDWYEVLPLGDNVVALSVGDVVGKGPTAAAVMGQLRSALAGYLLEGHSPGAALERLDRFADRIKGAAGSTCACLTFNHDTGELRWTAAGHPPPLVVESETSRFLSDSGGAVLGVPDRGRYAEHRTVLEPGTSIVLYTDGLVERRGSLIDEGLDRLLRTASEARDLPPEDLANAITGALLADGHDDDVALVVVRHVPAPLRESLPAEPGELSGMRRRVGLWGSAAGLSADLLDDLQLALGEAAANSVDHAYPDGSGDFDYEVARDDRGGVHVVVRDHGRWRPVPPDNGHRGRGLRIIRALSESSSFDHGAHGTTIDFVLVEPTAPPRRRKTDHVETPTGLTVDDTGESVQVIRITGDLDLTTSDGLRAAVLDRVAAAAQPRTDVDLTGLNHLSSSGIALLLEAASATARAGRSLSVLAEEGSAPARILELSGLSGVSTGRNLVVRTISR
ncbi:SpoIIE family protein phosphatase [Umezawaea endophytica]|uniref:SpoIIE family protein phosphatase n=1 Tax=Umezawaea endophytica TaxID=1654476 RepID=A0A9X2VFW7_9PSEU|nr:SpoIIE family protein phosphatase [Umezawaea endophytica]MCS7475915.1 SpoIIE family protein phosphatase [Umezawaea endophytica]